MNYLDQYGLMTNHGFGLIPYIEEEANKLLGSNKSADEVLSEFQKLLNNEGFITNLHKKYCKDNNVYPEKYTDIPVNPIQIMHIRFIIMVEVNYKIAEYFLELAENGQ